MSINIQLDFNNYDKWKSKMKGFEKKLQTAINEGLEEFTQRFKTKLLEYAQLNGITDPYVLGSIIITKYRDGFILTINSEQVAYIEYGVGIVGSQNKHPKPEYGWVYDINNHGTKGWVYPVITEADQMYDDKTFISKDGNILAWTKGHKPKPFIYQTWLWGTRSITPIVEKHIRRIKID